MTGQTPKVTVLISTYNRPDYLREAIDSVVRQRLQDWELLVMNDGGMDVREIVEGFGDGRIRYLHDPVNRGLAHRLNIGLNQARGDYIAYLGDDDLYYSNHLEVLSNALNGDPELGAVYSDLYAVQFVRDERNGKRYPLNKFIQVARDYNRDFMFFFNHTLHVSLMHRRDLALRAGGYDETVTVLIDWDMTRKLSFYTDFQYIPVVTGEYTMPIFKSDRISNLEREDSEKFKHNLRKIRADLPPEPWPKVDRIAVILPVRAWTDSFRSLLTDLLDHLPYPSKVVLVNQDLQKGEDDCRKVLGKIGELKNVLLHTPGTRLSSLDAYRFGAQCVDADYLFLSSDKVDTQNDMRLFTARHFFKPLKAEGYEAIKWDIGSERSSPFDLFMEKEVFLRKTDGKSRDPKMLIKTIPTLWPASFQCDYHLYRAKKSYEQGDLPSAYQSIRTAEACKAGGAASQYLIDLYAKVCFDLKRFDEAEEKCKNLIARGYPADNWLRLGKIYQETGRYPEAIEAYRKGLSGVGLKEEDLGSPVFPISVPMDFDVFKAYIGLGESFLKERNWAESAKMFRRAAKLKANSPLPPLGFGRLFLETGEWNRAEEALLLAEKRNGKDAELLHTLGLLHEKKNNHETAYAYFRRAAAGEDAKPEAIESAYRMGSALNKWEDMRALFEEGLIRRPGSLPTLEKLSRVYLQLGNLPKAKALLARGFVLHEHHPGLREVSLQIHQRSKPFEGREEQQASVCRPSS